MLTVPEAARRVGRDPETVRRWIRAGKLTAWKLGTQHVIDEDDLALLVGPANLRPPDSGQPVGPLAESEIVAAVHRSRAARAHRIAEAVATYEPTAARATRGTATGDPWLPAIVGRIVHVVDPVRIILFGSRVRGGAREDSDYDLLVVFDVIDDRRATRMRIRAAIDDLPIAKDVVVATTEEESWAPRLWGDIIQAALAEGRVVYERA